MHTNGQKSLSTPLLLERIEIRRMPGFNRIGFTLDQLSPGINIIFGPNAAGKSTTARAILALLWPEAGSGRESLLGRMHMGGDDWSVQVDVGYREWQRAGLSTDAPPLPSVEGRDRYILSLPDLLVAHDRNFAAMIARESVGGYDLQQTAKDAGLDQSLSGKKNIPAALKDAQKSLDEALAEHESLVADERQLAELQRQYDEADAGAAHVEIYDRLLEWMDAQQREREAKDALAVYPSWMSELRGDEHDLLNQLQDEAEQAKNAISLALETQQDALKSQAETGLPQGGVPSLLLRRLRSTVETMVGWEQQLLRIQDDLQAAIKQRQSAAMRLGDQVDIQALPKIDGVAISAFAKLAEGWQDLGARQRDLMVQQERLTAQAKKTADAECIRRGIRLLVQWLLLSGQSKTATKRSSLWLGVIGWVVAAASSLLLSLRVDATYTWLLVGTLLSLFMMWSRLKHREQPKDREEYEREYKELTLELGSDIIWTEDGVTKKLEALQPLLLDALAESERVKQLSHVESQLSRLREEEANLEQERLALVDRYGLPQKDDVTKLWWLVQRISDWQEADDAVIRLEQSKHEMTVRIEQEIKDIRDELDHLGYKLGGAQLSARSVADLKAIAADLEDRMSKWQAAQQKIDQAQNDVKRSKQALENAAAQREAVFGRLGLTGDDETKETAVRDGCRTLSQYKSAHQALTGAVSVRESAERALLERLESSDLDNPEEIVVFGRSLHEWTKDEALREKERAQTQAQQRTEIHEAMTRINERIQQAKRGRNIETALADYDRARDDLWNLFEQECRLELGRLLLDHVHQATKERDRPQVFHKARERFARMTHGAYRLELDDGEQPSFRAIDTATGEGKSLDQLSSGTRAQLLIAVRVAFVESIETGIRLPIIFDEALANSDDVRADAIIEAVLDLAASGRQVFYFTAQADEVGKWRAALTERPEIAHRLVDLRDVKEMDLVKQRPLPKQPRIGGPKVPEPRDLEYEAYGRLLNVPGIDPYDEEIGHVHLWHLLDDPHALQRFLSSSIETWGALKTLYELDGLEGLGEWAVQAYDKAAVAARCLQAVISASRIGRGRPVDRQVLLDSNAISDAFLDSASELAAACDYDAKRLMEAIDSGELKRFRADNKEQLRGYFEEHGFLDHRQPLSDSVLSAHVIAAIGPDLAKGLISGEHMERLIRTVGHELNDQHTSETSRHDST